MTKVLIVHASRHGGTREIAERIGEVLRAGGLEVEVAAADQVGDLHAGDAHPADAFVVGSAVYMGHWLDEALDFTRRNHETLATRPTWLFCSGPLRGSTASKGAADPMTDALGPEDGPGSGGRKKIAELSGAIHPRDDRVFMGRFDPRDPPRATSERLVRMMPAFKSVLPAGDFRDWDAIEEWAREIAATLTAAPVVGTGR